MAQTTLVSSISRTGTFPIVEEVTASNSCGMLSLTLNGTWTEQMIHELSTINIKIYLQDGTLYATFDINMSTVNEELIDLEPTAAYSIPIYDIPPLCEFHITPLFDEFALSSHNAEVKAGNIKLFNTTAPGVVDTDINDYSSELWTVPTSTFDVTITFDDSNISAGGVTVDNEVIQGSANAVSGGAVYTYVNNAVSTNTANFIGTFNSTSELNAYSGAVSNNDYAFVIREYSVLTSQPSDWTTNWTNYYSKSVVAPTWEANKYYSKSGDTYTLTTSQPNDWTTNYADYYTVFNEDSYRNVVGVDTYTALTSDSAPTFVQNTYYTKDTTYYDRYKYNADTDIWGYEYSLEFTQLSAAQWAAINSGLTSADKDKLDNIEPYANNYTLPDATTTTKGGVIVGNGLTVSDGTISLGDVSGLNTGSKELYAFAYNTKGQVTDASKVTSLVLNCVSSGLDGTPETYLATMQAFFNKYGANTMTPAQLTELVEQWYMFTRDNWNGWTTFPTTGASTGTRGGDNVGMTCTPSTDATAGTDNFAGLPLFYPIDVNYVIDADTKDILITAIDGITTGFERDNPNKFVGVMQMAGYEWHSVDTINNTYTDGYSSQPYDKADECYILPEAVRLDGTYRQFVVHTKYLGVLVDNKLKSYSGAIPTSYVISHNDLNTYGANNGSQYSGGSVLLLSFLQLMTHIKYASLTLDGIIQGCVNYNIQGTATQSGTNTNRIYLSNASSFILGSSVIIGPGGSTDRNNAGCYSSSGQDGCIITDVQSTYIEVNKTIATVTSGSTIVSTFTWATGTNDNIKGNDGSKASPSTGQYPAKLQGIEYSMGTWEVFGDIIMQANPANSTYTYGFYDFYICKDASKRSTSITSNYEQLSTVLPYNTNTSATWRYITKITFDNGIAIPSSTLNGSSSTFTKDGFYYVATPSTKTTRQWLSFGNLNFGVASGGLSAVYGASALSHRHWNVGGRVSCGEAFRA